MKTLLEYISGSRLYGMNTLESDYDIRGTFIQSIKEFLSLSSPEQTETHGEYNGLETNTILYDLRKYIKLLTENNPNIIEALFVPAEFVRISDPLWHMIMRKRHLFVSKKVKFTFSGYAIAQLKRIKLHRGYLLKKIDHEPTREEFGLPGHSTIDQKQLGSILTIEDQFIAEGIKDTARREKAFHNAMNEYRSYKHWEAERNERRRELEAQYGYDTKHASHLFRLFKMGEDLLLKREIEFPLSYADSLIAIRNGAWNYDDLIMYAESMDERFNALYEKSDLPHAPDHKAIQQLMEEIYSTYYGELYNEDNHRNRSSERC